MLVTCVYLEIKISLHKLFEVLIAQTLPVQILIYYAIQYISKQIKIDEYQ